MKKIITSSLALAVVFVAGAALKPVAVKPVDNAGAAKVVNKSELKAVKANDQRMVVSSVLKNDLNVAAEGDAESPELKPLYACPDGTFYTFFSIETADDSYWYPNVGVVPAYTDNTWYNMTYYKDPTTGRPTRPSNASYQWALLNSKDEAIEESTETNFVYAMEPSIYKGSGFYAPYLTVGGLTYQCGYEGKTQYIGEFFEYGGAGAGDPEYMDMLKSALESQVGTITDFANGGATTYSRSSDFYFTNFTGGAFCWPSAQNRTVEFYYASEDLPEDAFKVIGFSQLFPKPSSPYVLSWVKPVIAVNCEAGAKIKFQFCKVTENGVDLTNPICEYEHVFVDAVPLDKDGYLEWIPIEVPVTSVDEASGDELDYALIDTDMMMVITGFANDDKMITFNPTIAGFIYDRTFDTYNPEDQSVMAMLQAGDAIGFAQTNYIAGFATQPATTYCTYNAFNMTIGIEYPYLAPFENLVTEEVYERESEVVVNLNPENTDEAIVYLCPGDVEDVMVALENGDDLPAWLGYGAFPAELIEESNDGQKYFYFAVGYMDEENMPNESCNVVLTYKGQSTTIKVNSASTNSIDNVTMGDAAELDWNAPVYNVMGQKVNNAYKGIAIQNGRKFMVK